MNPNPPADNFAQTNGFYPTYMIDLYEKFWGQPPATPPSSQGGILVHELAHAVDRKVGDLIPQGLKTYIDKPGDPRDLNLWRQWAMVKGTFMNKVINIMGVMTQVWVMGGLGTGVSDPNDKINDANCYTYFAERQR